MPRPPTRQDRRDDRALRIPELPSRPGPNGLPGAHAPTEPEHRNRGRRTLPAGRGFTVLVVCLTVWLLLDAPALKRAAEASPIGARRSISLAFLRPLAGVSTFLQLDHVRNAFVRAIGRDPAALPGEPSIAPVPVAPRDPAEREDAGADASLSAPTRDDPLRLLVIGDSFATGVGAAMGRGTNPRLVNVEARGVISTGLTRPDYFNWTSALREIVERFRPGVIVVMLGGNDAQTLTVPGGQPIPLSAQDRWQRTYADRVEALARVGTDAGARVVWIGLPPMRDINRDHQAHRLDEIYRRVAASAPGVAYVNSLELFARPGGGYAAYLPDDDGEEQLVREADGEHFTELGYDWVAEAVLEALEKHWELPVESIRR
jgi:uncharacterized protein